MNISDEGIRLIKAFEGLELTAYQDAIKNNVKRYFSGKVCPQGHVAERFTSTRGCVVCASENSKKWSKKNVERETAKKARWYANNSERQFDSTIKRKYGITAKEYYSMYKSQGGVCAICLSKSQGKRKLQVDHSHLTGSVRGLLCINCNTVLGRIKDDKEILQRAIEYLQKTEK